MAKKSVHRHHQTAAMNHREAQTAMMDYCFGRLSHTKTSALEDHVFECHLCEDEGFDIIVSERTHTMQQRPHFLSNKRRSSLILFVLASMLVLALGVIISGIVSLPMLSDGSVHRLPLVSNTPLPVTPTTTTLPMTLKSDASIGVKGITAVAWSPDSSEIVTGVNPVALGGTANGGVTVLSGTTIVAHLLGFEGYPAPGALAWSVDGKKVAAAGHLTLMIWTVAPNAAPLKMTLPSSPATNLYVYDTSTGSQIGTYPATIFMPTGYVQWQPDGKLVSAPPVTGVDTNIPSPSGSTFALWSATQGIRIFRDTTANVTYLGVNDADRQAHTAFLRWSPDGKYIIWGYPQVPISSIVLTNAGTPVSGTPSITTTAAVPSAILSPNPAFAMLVSKVSQSTVPEQSIVVWASPDGLKLAYGDTTTSPATLGILDASTATVSGTITLNHIPAAISLNMLSWQSVSPPHVTIVTADASATEYVASP